MLICSQPIRPFAVHSFQWFDPQGSPVNDILNVIKSALVLWGKQPDAAFFDSKAFHLFLTHPDTLDFSKRYLVVLTGDMLTDYLISYFQLKQVVIWDEPLNVMTATEFCAL
jgi:hypothetical protein